MPFHHPRESDTAQALAAALTELRRRGGSELDEAGRDQPDPEMVEGWQSRFARSHARQSEAA